MIGDADEMSEGEALAEQFDGEEGECIRQRERTYDWAILTGEGDFVHCDGRHVELFRTRNQARKFCRTIKRLFPKARIVRVVTETREMYK